MANPITSMFIRPLKQRQNAQKLAITSPNGIREERYISIGGIEQWVTIRGQDRANPVLVILHGGPASPYTPFNSWITEWEQHFTVVQWDQRGAGKTYGKNTEAATGEISFQHLADDGIELMEYTKKHLEKDKVILLGSSVGSFVGLLIAQQRPDLLSAYIGTEQNAPGGIELSYQLAIDTMQHANNKHALKSLQKMGNDKSRWTYKQFLAMNKLAINATKNVPHMVNDLMLPALLFAPNYTMNDIKAVQKGMEYSAKYLFKEIRDFNFDAVGYRFDMPFFVLQGESDIITPVESARNFVDRIQAPKKEFATISHAGHLAAFCNPHEFLMKIRDFTCSQG
jgi:pimeloyl-ACP methyl ester carboxylesterase